MKVVRKQLTPDEVTPAGTRYDSDCNCIQASPDGGTTWNDAPGLDPRSQTAFARPGRGGGADQACNVAANATDKLKSMVMQAEGELEQFQLATALVGIVLLFLPEAGLLVDLFIAVAEALITIGSDAILGAFTDAQWSLIECIIYCSVDADGQIPDSAMSVILAEIEAECDPVVYDVMFFVLPSLGSVGLSNAGNTGSLTGDCSGCATCTWEKSWDFTIGAHTFVPQAGCCGAYSPGVGWPNDSSNCGGYYRAGCVMAFNFPLGSTVTHVRLDWTGHQTYSRAVYIQHNSGGTQYGYSDGSNTPGSSPIEADISVVGDGELWDFAFFLDDPSYDVCAGVTMTISGTGVEPSFPA